MTGTTNLDKIVEQLSNLTILETNELVSILEDKWGVSAAAVAAPAAVSSGSSSDAENEKTSFDVSLESVGASKINVIKAVKDALGVGLKEAKELADKAPVVIKAALDKSAAEDLKKKIEDAGATIELK